MKSRIWLLAMLTVLVTAQAHGAYTDTGGGSPTAWQKVTTTVKGWYNYWMGDKPADAPAAPPTETATATAPTSSPTAPAAATPTTGLPAAQASAPAASASSKPVASKPSASAEQTAFRQQPIYSEPTQGSSLNDVQSVRDKVKGASLLSVAKPGRKGTSQLAKSKEGVPTADWKQVKVTKRVPRLDIGTENLISRHDFTSGSLSWGLIKPSDMKRLPSPSPVGGSELNKALATAAASAKALGPKGMQATMRTVGSPVNHETIAKINYPIQELNEVKPLPLKNFTEEELKMVAALILFEKGNHCHMIMGLFNQLKEKPATRIEATYHLGACADQLDMHQSAYDLLSQVIVSEDREFAADALAMLAKGLPAIYELDFYKMLKGVKGHKGMITEASRNDVTYRMAKGAYRAGDYKTSIVYADQVTEPATFYDDARFLSAMNSFALNEKPAALKKLEKLWTEINGRKLGDSKIRALTSVNLARMYFAQKRYDKAIEHYMAVPKDHALWVQALIEQGWTQLAINDFSGAIGNMYSLHSPYFKAVYQPESFVVRTIGYLNICQYGDAYKTLTWLEKDYRDWYSRMLTYLSAKHTPIETYNTVKTYIRGKSSDSLEGVPYQIWREMARRKDFLNLQTALNDKQDESHRYEGVNEKIKTEKAGIRSRAEASKKRFDNYRANLSHGGKNNPEWTQGLQREKELTIAYRYQLAILEQSRQGYLDYQKTCEGRLTTEAATLTRKAGETLAKRAEAMRTEMGRVLENNEFLRYEVFAGSGENIRYQVAGGEVSGENNRVPAHIKPTKMMNWNFDGEFWEDEIGSYRSSLQNACPASAHGSVEKPIDDQAKLMEH